MIVYVGYPADASVILKQTGELGLKKKWIAAEGIADPVMFDNAHVAKQMEGLLLTTSGRSEQEEKEEGSFQIFAALHKHYIIIISVFSAGLCPDPGARFSGGGWHVQWFNCASIQNPGSL